MTARHSEPSIIRTGSGASAVNSNGDLFINELAGFQNGTASAGDVSQAYSFISRINLQAGPVYALQIGGANNISALSADRTGNLLIAGVVYYPGLPITSGSYLPSVPSVTSGVGFACKLKAADGSVVFCTYLDPRAMTVVGVGSDAAGNIYVLGGNRGSTPTTPGALALGNRQLLLMKLDPSGSKLIYSAEFGGSGSQESAGAISVDAAGNVYVTGYTFSADFPGAENGAIPTMNPSQYYASFIAKVDPTGSQILSASYGRAEENTRWLAVDGAGEMYMAGYTPFYLSIFVRKYSADAANIIYDRTITHSQSNIMGDIAVDTSGGVTVVGSSSAVDFPEYQPTGVCHLVQEFGSDAFLVRLDSNGALLQSTFIGGDADQYAIAVRATPSQAFVAEATGLKVPEKVSILQLGPSPATNPGPALGCAGNAASFRPQPFAPGEIVGLFGGGLGPAKAAVWPGDGSARTSLAGVQVTFDGVPAPLLYVQDAQINAIVPWSAATTGTAQMCVSGVRGSQCTSVVMGKASPAAFQESPGYAAAVNQDGSINSAQHPAPPGSIVALFFTGLGPVSPAATDGTITQLPLPSLSIPWRLIFQDPRLSNLGTSDAEVLYEGPAPLAISGLYQVNFRAPSEQTVYYTLLTGIPNQPYSPQFLIYSTAP